MSVVIRCVAEIIGDIQRFDKPKLDISKRTAMDELIPGKPRDDLAAVMNLGRGSARIRRGQKRRRLSRRVVIG